MFLFFSAGASGGVCERWKAYTGGKYKSLNTGVVTTLNYGSDVPLKVTEITLAHEIGHNFGSQVEFNFIFFNALSIFYICCNLVHYFLI